MTTTETDIYECPVAGCTRPRKFAQNMCSRHWASIPNDLQVAVLDTWDAIELGTPSASWPAYLAARDAALATVPGYDMSAADGIDREALAAVAAQSAIAV